jgi:hypothetical protein
MDALALMPQMPLLVMAVGLLIVGAGILVSRYQMKSYGSHVDRVSQINEEIVSLSRKGHALAEEQLAVLKQIKTLLEDRKS